MVLQKYNTKANETELRIDYRANEEGYPLLCIEMIGEFWPTLIAGQRACTDKKSAGQSVPE